MSKKHDPNSQSTPVQPLYVSTMNCREVVGQSWRWTRSIAKQLGVPLITPAGTNKTLIPAQALIDALERAGKLPASDTPPPPAPGSAEEVEALRAELGLRLVRGGR